MVPTHWASSSAEMRWPCCSPISVTRSPSCTFVAEKDTRVATVAVGYGDGYHRAVSGKGFMLAGGKRCPILGRICMDQTMIDVTDVPGVKLGDRVTLIGEQQGQRITAEELAEWAGTISYEVLLGITRRVHRVWLHA